MCQLSVSCLIGTDGIPTNPINNHSRTAEHCTYSNENVEVMSLNLTLLSFRVLVLH